MPAQKRKLGSRHSQADEIIAEQPLENADAPQPEPQPEPSTGKPSAAPVEEHDEPDKAQEILSKAQERQERFKALQARQTLSKKQNMKASAAESQRLATDPNMMTALNRKHAVASHKLLKADAEAAGDDFERKRAWDWTVEESEKWDRRMEKKEKHREDVAFKDYRQDARKAYKKQMRDLKPDLEAYEKTKMEAVQRSAQSGGLEILETETGELIAVDKDGTFYSTADSTDFIQSKPDRAAVDRLVTELRKAEELGRKKRRDKGKGDEEGDVTYINEKVSACPFWYLRNTNKSCRTSNSTTSLRDFITRYISNILPV